MKKRREVGAWMVNSSMSPVFRLLTVRTSPSWGIVSTDTALFNTFIRISSRVCKY